MAADAILFDDDTLFAGLVREVLGDLGLRVLYYPTGKGALEHVRRERPRLVLSDIMMPGLDGITLCAAIKRDPELGERTKVVVVSGKGYAEDRARAETARADLFFQKPLDMKAFAGEIRRLLVSGGPLSTSAVLAPTLRFWQDAGGPGCATLRTGGRLLVFDAGAGLKRAVESGEAKGITEAWALFTHFHADHIAEAGSLKSLVQRGAVVHLVGEDLGRLQGLAASFASRSGDGAGRAEAHGLGEGGELSIGGIRLSAIQTLHPGACLAFRLEGEGVSLVFAPDNELELEWEKTLTDYAQKLVAFCKGAGLLVHDARYRLCDLPERSGHSTPEAALKLAVRAGVGTLALHHLDPSYSPRDRGDIERSVAEAASLESGGPKILVSSDRAFARAR
jgi:CheY-like chemotaxis protein/ribonuclease BN (tRNA processing enzyme)